jgi:hypothetical protein
MHSPTSDEAGVVVLTWDKTKYVLITTGLDDDGILAAGERYDDVSANMKAITVTLTYADSKVTKVESSWTKNDDSVGTITVEFKGTGAQTIVFPTDLDSYTEQQINNKFNHKNIGGNYESVSFVDNTMDWKSATLPFLSPLVYGIYRVAKGRLIAGIIWIILLAIRYGCSSISSKSLWEKNQPF